MPRCLDEVLSITGDFSRNHNGCIMVYASDYSRSSYYGLADYAVSSSLSGGVLALVERKNNA